MNVQVTRKKVKNFNLRVKGEDQIMLSVPLGTSHEAVERFLQSYKEWIEKSLAKISEKTSKDPGIFSYLGEDLELICQESEKTSVEKKGRALYVFQGKNKSREEVLDQWMKEESYRIFLPLFKEARKKIPFFVDPMVKVRKMVSRWGSANLGKNVVTLNTKLLHYPLPVMEYVMIHELVHFRHPHHQKSFYEELEKILPHWKELKKTLGTL